MTKYEARWANAKRLAEKANELLAQGNLVVLGGGGTFLREPLVITDRQIIQKLTPKSAISWFENDPEVDHGLHTPIEEYTRKFNLRAFAPVPIEWSPDPVKR